MRLTPGDRAYSTGEKSAHVIRSVDARFAYPWCADFAEIALLPEVDGRPESPKIAPEGMPLCASCREVMGGPAAEDPRPGQLLLRRRAELEWTQAEAAAATGVHRRVLGGIERGRQGVTPAMALRLEAGLGVPAVEWLRLQNLVDLERARRCA